MTNQSNAHILRTIRVMIVVFYVIAIFSVSWYGYQEYNSTVDNATQRIANDSRMLAEHAARTFGEVDSLIHAVKDHLTFSNSMHLENEKRVHDILKSHFKKLPEIASLYVISPDGKLFASTLGYPINPISLADRDNFIHHRDTSDDLPYISRPYKNRLTGKWVIGLSHRLSRSDGSFGGILAATIDINYFDSMYLSLFKNSATHVGLMRKDGIKVVTVPTEIRNIESAASLKDSELYKRFQASSGNGTFRGIDSIDGSDSLIAYAHFPSEFPLVASVEVHWNDMLRSWRKWTIEHVFLTIVLMIPLIILYRRLVSRLAADQQKSDELALLSRIVEQSPVSIVITDKEGTIQYVNDRFCELTGYSREEAIGQNPRVLKSDITPSGTFLDMWQNLANGNEWRGELCNQKKDKSLYWEMAYIFPVVNSSGELTHYAAIKENITSRKEAEDELIRARQAAEEATHSKSLFLATMSHEIRTPMNAILGMSYLALQTGLDSRQRGYVEKVTIAAKSLLSIINDILDFSKIEAGKMGLEKIPLRLDELLEGVQSIIRVAADEKNVLLECTIAPDVPTAIIADPTRLRQILLNLASNAVKFTDSGTVTVAVTCSRQAVQEGMAALLFSVKDTGIGMNDEQMEKIFAPFSQADSSITRRFGGTGLGLSIVSKLLEMMESSLEVVSQPEQGSTFSFTVVVPTYCPFGDEAGEEPVSSDALNAISGSRILLMEDNRINRIVAREMLQRLNMEVVTADNGKEGVDLVYAGEQFDLIISDVQMPDMDGCEATILLRSRYTKEELPIVAMTGYVLNEEVQQLLKNGVNECIVKPIDPDELQRVLVTWIRPKQQKPGDQYAPSFRDREMPCRTTVPGFNLQAAYNRLGNDCDLLLSVINDATPHLIKSVEHVLELLHADVLQKEALLFELHSLAGSCSNIGAETISQAARSLERHFKGDQTSSLDDLTASFSVAAEELFVSLEQFRTSKITIDREAIIDREKLQPLLTSLYQQLKGNRGSSLHICRDLRQSAPSIPNLEKLEREIKRFDFKHALVTLEDIAAVMNVSLTEVEHEI